MNRAIRPLLAVYDWAVCTEASSRSSALIRVGLVAVMWARLAYSVILPKMLVSPQYVLLCAGFFVFSTMLLVGLWSRFSCLMMGGVLLSMVHYFGYELGQEPWTHHHINILANSTFLLAFAPVGGSYSVDRWIAVERARRAGVPPPAERGNIMGLRLIALQMSAMYLWTAIDKSEGPWLSGARLDYIAMWYYFPDYPEGWGVRTLILASAWATLVLEYALAVGMLFRRTRLWLAPLGYALHGFFYVLLPIRSFSATVFATYLAFFDPDAVHRLIDRLSGHRQPD
ncbi:MAG: hypothetical protein B7733_16260 [Myxococcales bacterium FL481]|nr:MAG: hypothetical protein B7733_16260 [Myxococcales bacterium FL481]